LLQRIGFADENGREAGGINKDRRVRDVPEPARHEGEQQLVNVLKTLSSPLTAAAFSK